MRNAGQSLPQKDSDSFLNLQQLAGEKVVRILNPMQLFRFFERVEECLNLDSWTVLVESSLDNQLSTIFLKYTNVFDLPC